MKKFTLMSLTALACAALVAGCEKKTVKVADVSVFPKTITLQIGKTYDLMATVTPSDATDKGVVWASSADDIATVDGNGRITAVAAGMADITARTADGSDKLAKATVKVIPTAVVNITSTPGLTEVNEFKYSEMVDAEGKPASPVTITVRATRGVGALKIALTTDNAEIRGALAGIGLAGQFDLVTASADQAALLEGFFGGGVPTGDAVLGKDVVTLDLSVILTLMAGIQGGVERFDIAVEASDVKSYSTDDAEITKTATLKMKFTDDVTISEK